MAENDDVCNGCYQSKIEAVEMRAGTYCFMMGCYADSACNTGKIIVEPSSVALTIRPSVAPTIRPSVAPTIRHSVAPTIRPPVAPSAVLTSAPSAYPISSPPSDDQYSSGDYLLLRT